MAGSTVRKLRGGKKPWLSISMIVGMFLLCLFLIGRHGGGSHKHPTSEGSLISAADERRDIAHAAALSKTISRDCDTDNLPWQKAVCRQWEHFDKSCLVGKLPFATPLCKFQWGSWKVHVVENDNLAALRFVEHKYKSHIPRDAPELSAIKASSPELSGESISHASRAARWSIDTPPASDGQLHLLFDTYPCARHGCCSLPWMLRPNSTDLQSARNHFLQNEYLMVSELPFKPEYILDAGGVGMAPAFFSLLYPDASILRLEPHGSNFEAGYRNSIWHPNIRQVNVGLWDKNTVLQMCDNVDLDWGPDWPFKSSQEQAFYSREPSDPPCKKVAMDNVPVALLEDVMRKHHIPRFDLIKMDIEGAEVRVFREPGMKRILRNAQVYIAELHKWVPGAKEVVHEVFSEIGGFLHFHDDENDIWVRSSMLRC